MGELRNRLRLPLEALAHRLAPREVIRQDLDGHRPIEPRVPRLPDLSHLSRAERRENLVRSETTSRRDRHERLQGSEDFILIVRERVGTI